MSSGAKPIVYLERKRLAFVAVMAFLAGFLFYVRTDIYLGGIHLSWITGTLYAVVISICALIVCIVLPSMRFMIEAVAVSRLMLSFFVLAVPNIGYTILANPMVTALVTVTGGVAASRLMHGRLQRQKPKGLRAHVVPQNLFKRIPVSVHGSPWQRRFVDWLEDVQPISVQS